MNPNNYQDALNKWLEFKKLIEKGEVLDGKAGWKKISLFDRCGYCIEFNDNCNKCPLCPRYCVGLKASFVKLGIGLVFSVFWRFVREMQKNKCNKERALNFVNKMISRIKQDNPTLQK